MAQICFRKIGLPIINGIELVELDTIRWCAADSNYSIFHMVCGKRIVVTRTLKTYENRLPSGVFVRIHQSSIINLNRMVKYTSGDGGLVLMEDGTELQVARSRKGDLLTLIRDL